MKYFITFGAGNQDYYDAGNRLAKQVTNLQLFDKINFYTDVDLRDDHSFWTQHSNFIENNSRGYGYWLWKSYLIKKTMSQLQDGDILMYLDCGCEIEISKKRILQKYLELVKTEKFIGTMADIDYKEKQWTKMDLIVKLDMHDEKYLIPTQHQGGTNLFLVCDKTRELVNTWYELCCDYHNIDDSPSIHQNLPEFFEHRHDQSVFSLLIKKYNMCGKNSLNDCILVDRNISGISKSKVSHTELVSVIIPTYNRFQELLNTVQSVKSQTYKNIEIIVINDGSIQKEYYEYPWEDNGIHIVHLEKNTNSIFGFPCVGYVRNKGIEMAKGKYVAFCDDDDSWFPAKTELQIMAMKETECKMSSTDGLIGEGIYRMDGSYKKYNAEHYYDILQTIFRNKGSSQLENGFPKIWNLDFLKIHNCIICSSLMIEKEILDKITNMKCISMSCENIESEVYPEHYDCWLRALEHTNNVYLEDICFYYNSAP